MKRFFKNHVEWALGFLSLVLIAIMVWIVIWSTSLALRNISRAFGSLNGSATPAKFDIEKAEQLDFRGLQSESVE